MTAVAAAAVRQGWTALHTALHGGHFRVAYVLFTHKNGGAAALNTIEDKEQYTPIDLLSPALQVIRAVMSMMVCICCMD